MRNFKIIYTLNNSENVFYLNYGGPNDLSLIKDSAIYEIKKYLKGEFSGKIEIKRIEEQK